MAAPAVLVPIVKEDNDVLIVKPVLEVHTAFNAVNAAPSDAEFARLVAERLTPAARKATVYFQTLRGLLEVDRARLIGTCRSVMYGLFGDVAVSTEAIKSAAAKLTSLLEAASTSHRENLLYYAAAVVVGVVVGAVVQAATGGAILGGIIGFLARYIFRRPERQQREERAQVFRKAERDANAACATMVRALSELLDDLSSRTTRWYEVQKQALHQQREALRRHDMLAHERDAVGAQRKDTLEVIDDAWDVLSFAAELKEQVGVKLGRLLQASNPMVAGLHIEPALPVALPADARSFLHACTLCNVRCMPLADTVCPTCLEKQHRSTVDDAVRGGRLRPRVSVVEAHGVPRAVPAPNHSVAAEA